MGDPIKPRTDSERRAFVSGYAQAVIDCNDRGIKFASDEVALMAEMEGMVTHEEIEEARKGQSRKVES